MGDFAPTDGEQQLGARALTKAVRVQGQTVGFSLRASGSALTPELTCELFADQALKPGTGEAVRERARFFLSLDDDLTPFYALAEHDAPFKKVVQQLYGYHQVKFLTPFENACWAVLTQRTSGHLARVMKRNLVETYGGSVDCGSGLLWAFPEPADLGHVSAEELGAVVGNSRKAEYLAAAVQAFGQIKEDWLRQAPHDEVKTWLRSIHGIGAWSATFVLLRGLGRMENTLFEDSDSRFTEEMTKAAARVYGPLSFEVFQAHARRYGAWQGYWAHYLRAAGTGKLTE
ncbi:DNA-3-methyladenine glycosylase family protein [Deinococcus sp. UYEF24]